MHWFKKRLIKAIDSILIRFFYNPNTMENFLRAKGCSIGKNNRIYITDFGSEPYLIKIGNHCSISKGTWLVTHDGGVWVLRDKYPKINVFGKIEIKDNCYIGLNAIILPNVTIGPNSVVGAGAIVTKDVPPNTVVAGVPAKVVRTLDEYEKKCLEKFETYSLNSLKKERWRESLVTHYWGGVHK